MIFVHFKFLPTNLRGKKGGKHVARTRLVLSSLRTVSALVELAQKHFDSPTGWTRVDELPFESVLKPVPSARSCWSKIKCSNND